MKWFMALQLLTCAALTCLVTGQETSAVLGKPDYVQEGDHVGRAQQYGSWDVTVPEMPGGESDRDPELKRTMAWDFTKKNPHFFDVSHFSFRKS